MFGNMKNIASLMGQMGQMREKIERLQQELGEKYVDGDAGAGAVRVTINGRLEIQRIAIDKPMLQSLTGSGDEADLTMVEELIQSATQDAITKAKQLIHDEATKAAGGVELPGLSHLLG